MSSVFPTSDPRPRLVDTRLGPIAVTDEGPEDAPAILCVHGLPGTSRDFRYLAPQLAPRWRVVRVEMPGFGLSPAGEVRSLDGWARVLAALRDTLALDRPLLLAHSFGGGACLLAAAAGPGGWRGLALLASLGARVHRAMRWPPEAYARMARRVRSPLTRLPVLVVARLGYRRLRLPQPRSWRDLLLHLDLIASVDFAVLTAAARAVDLPALVAFCRDDRVSEPAIQEELAALLPAATVLAFPSGGHHLHRHHAAAVAAAIAELFGNPFTSR